VSREIPEITIFPKHASNFLSALRNPQSVMCVLQLHSCSASCTVQPRHLTIRVGQRQSMRNLGTILLTPLSFVGVSVFGFALRSNLAQDGSEVNPLHSHQFTARLFHRVAYRWPRFNSRNQTDPGFVLCFRPNATLSRASLRCRGNTLRHERPRATDAGSK